MKKTHPGFKAVQKKIAAKQGVGMERAGAILAAGARKAGKRAVKENPRLKRVSGRGQANQSGRGQAANRGRGQGR